MDESFLWARRDAKTGSEMSAVLESYRGRLTETTQVDIASLVEPPRALRINGVSGEYLSALTGVEADLPPIVVHRATMTVLDGVHRLRAARLSCRTTMTVRYFDGEVSDAFVLSVMLNARHGLPLSRDDKMAAARRIMASHPHWSDRWIAMVAGLSARTLAKLRAESGPAAATADRIGRDGRRRPLDVADRRRAAATYIEGHPQASLREVARIVGISPATVRDVRLRLERGGEPVSSRRTSAPATDGGYADQQLRDLGARLRRDPALRGSEVGRVLLRLLDLQQLDELGRERLVIAVPEHAVATTAEAVRACAWAWKQIEIKMTAALAVTIDARRRA